MLAKVCFPVIIAMAIYRDGQGNRKMSMKSLSIVMLLAVIASIALPVAANAACQVGDRACQSNDAAQRRSGGR